MAAPGQRHEPRLGHLLLQSPGDVEGDDLVGGAGEEEDGHAHAGEPAVDEVAAGEHGAHVGAGDGGLPLRAAQEVAEDEGRQQTGAIALQGEAGPELGNRVRGKRRLGEDGLVGQAGAGDEDEAAHALRMLRGELERHPPAHRHGHHVGLAQAHRVHEVADDRGLGGDAVVGALRLVGVAVAEEVGGVDAVSAGEAAEDGRPVFRAHGHAVDEHERRALAAGQIVDAVAACTHELAVDSDGFEVELSRTDVDAQRPQIDERSGRE